MDDVVAHDLGDVVAHDLDLLSERSKFFESRPFWWIKRNKQ